MLRCRRGNFSLVFASIVGFIGLSSVVAFAADLGKEIQSTCTRCHSYALVTAKIQTSPTERDWVMLIDKMKNAGLTITSEKQAEFAKYLAGQSNKK